MSTLYNRITYLSNYFTMPFDKEHSLAVVPEQPIHTLIGDKALTLSTPATTPGIVQGELLVPHIHCGAKDAVSAHDVAYGADKARAVDLHHTVVPGHTQDSRPVVSHSQD